MGGYAVQREFSFGVTPATRAIAVAIGSGNVLVEAWTGSAWTKADLLTTDGVHEIYTAGLTIRVTPTGGASYFINERTDT